jgi:hypothetical protein
MTMNQREHRPAAAEGVALILLGACCAGLGWLGLSLATGCLPLPAGWLGVAPLPRPTHPAGLDPLATALAGAAGFGLALVSAVLIGWVLLVLGAAGCAALAVRCGGRGRLGAEAIARLTLACSPRAARPVAAALLAACTGLAGIGTATASTGSTGRVSSVDGRAVALPEAGWRAHPGAGRSALPLAGWSSLPDASWSPRTPTPDGHGGRADLPAAGWTAGPPAAPTPSQRPGEVSLVSSGSPRDSAQPGPPAQVVVRRGDSLWTLAARRLGPQADDAQVAAQWPRWWAANRAVIGDDPDLLVPGTVLEAPTRAPSRTDHPAPSPRRTS